MSEMQTRSLTVDGATPYAIRIGPRTWEQLPAAPGRIAVVVDENVWSLHGERLRAVLAPHRPAFRVLPSGEQHKTLTMASELYGWLAQLRLERGERLVAVGGGVTGDLAGFVAATWRRGVPFVQLPTTLLAMVDSSVGGKVAVDLPEGKNLVGAFHPPALVLAETAVVATLPERERWCGLAEAVKTALLSGGGLFDLLEAGLDRLAVGMPVDDALLIDVLVRCLEYKAGVVSRDPLEHGERAVLNLGHTIGHALESAGRYAQLLHGEAVAWGLRSALRLSGIGPDDAAMRLVDRLPRRSLRGIDPARVREALGSDKKSVGGRPRFVLLEAPGRPRYGCDVADDVLEAELARLFADGQLAEVEPS